MTQRVSSLVVVSAFLAIGGITGLIACQNEQTRGNELSARAAGLEVAVYKTPT